LKAILAKLDPPLSHLATGYAPGPRPVTFMYEGQAVP
jgi:hypothetical protein